MVPTESYEYTPEYTHPFNDGKGGGVIRLDFGDVSHLLLAIKQFRRCFLQVQQASYTYGDVAAANL